MNKTTIEIKALKEQLMNFNSESDIVCTTICDNIRELMDSCNDLNEKLITPFENAPNQDFYYFLIEVKPNIIIKVISRKIYLQQVGRQERVNNFNILPKNW